MGKIYILAKTKEKFNRCVENIKYNWSVNKKFVHLTDKAQILGVLHPYCVVYGSLYEFEFQDLYPIIISRWINRPFPGFSLVYEPNYDSIKLIEGVSPKCT